MKPILVVDDEPAIADLISLTLKQAGYNCQIAYDGLTAADMLEENDYVLALLDIMLPEIDGYDLLEYALTLKIPVIFVTAKGTIRERVAGLRLGADDYIVKPFEPEELLARVQSLIRRSGETQELININIHDVVVDSASHTVRKNGRLIQLTPQEFTLLLEFIHHPGTVLTREYLYGKVWGEEADFDSRTLDLHISRIRIKLEWQNIIRTQYKIGYFLEDKK